MGIQKYTYKKLVDLMNNLMYRINTVHLDMGGNHKYSLNHKAFPIVTELKEFLTHDIECERCKKLEELLKYNNELFRSYIKNDGKLFKDSDDLIELKEKIHDLKKALK